jgi:LacI family transcriptional regulator
MNIKEIAKLANVSIGTVDRVLNNRGKVSKETEETIRKIIKDSGYTTNIFGRQLSMSKTYVFSVLMPKLQQDSQYWEMSAKGIERAANELKPYKVKVKYSFYDRYSERSQKRVIKNVLESDIDGLLLAPINNSLIKDFLTNLSNKTPYVLFNANVPETQAVSFIGQDSFQSGVLAAKLMNLFAKEKNHFAAVIGIADDFHINERANGFRSYYKQNGNNRVEFYTLNYCDRDCFYELMEKITEKYKGLSGIFVPNSATHFAAEYLKTNDIKDIHIIGYDLVRENVDLLNEGYIDFLISQKADVQGYMGIYTLYKSVVLGEEVCKQTMMPIDIITKENLFYYQNADSN